MLFCGFCRLITVFIQTWVRYHGADPQLGMSEKERKGTTL